MRAKGAGVVFHPNGLAALKAISPTLLQRVTDRCARPTRAVSFNMEGRLRCRWLDPADDCFLIANTAASSKVSQYSTMYFWCARCHVRVLTRSLNMVLLRISKICTAHTCCSTSHTQCMRLTAHMHMLSCSTCTGVLATKTKPVHTALGQTLWSTPPWLHTFMSF
jgi:hypothetical protein